MLRFSSFRWAANDSGVKNLVWFAKFGIQKYLTKIASWESETWPPGTFIRWFRRSNCPLPRIEFYDHCEQFDCCAPVEGTFFIDDLCLFFSTEFVSSFLPFAEQNDFNSFNNRDLVSLTHGCACFTIYFFIFSCKICHFKSHNVVFTCEILLLSYSSRSFFWCKRNRFFP